MCGYGFWDWIMVRMRFGNSEAKLKAYLMTAGWFFKARV